MHQKILLNRRNTLTRKDQLYFAVYAAPSGRRERHRGSVSNTPKLIACCLRPFIGIRAVVTCVKHLHWKDATKAAKNAALRVVPHPAFPSMDIGLEINVFHLNRNIGRKCRAPYMGNAHLNTVMKRDNGTCRHDSTHGWIALQGMYGPKSGGLPLAKALVARSAVRLAGSKSCTNGNIQKSNNKSTNSLLVVELRQCHGYRKCWYDSFLGPCLALIVELQMQWKA